ncbi:hypothetical protein ACFQHO_25890 [Actinomadura yumaensis]|uniref:hypothetical protein n=1 Tax=Actinomadura yumaensis TaxID=111807 RepID=UPI00362143BD
MANSPTLSVGQGPYTGGRRADIFTYTEPVVIDVEDVTVTATVEDSGAAAQDDVPGGDVRENGDVPDSGPEELAALEEAMYGPTPTPVPEPEPAPQTVADPVAEVAATLPDKPLGVDAFRALLDAGTPKADKPKKAKAKKAKKKRKKAAPAPLTVADLRTLLASLPADERRSLLDPVQQTLDLEGTGIPTAA